MKKTNILIGAIFILALVTSSFHRADAANNCDFKSNLKELSEAQAGSRFDDSQENIKKELSVRKKILSQTIACSVNETLSLQSGIKLAPVSSAELREIQNRMILKLDEMIDYYKSQENVIGDLGIGGSKIFSANLKAWRNSNYVPMTDLGKNFLIFTKNQDILQTTQNRLNQINLTLKTLGLDDNQKISEMLNQARKNIRSADEENGLVKNVFKRLTWPNDISDVMVSSLQHLKDAYQNFFDIGKEAQSIIS